MKYPDTRHLPSLSCMGVTVSIADFLFAKAVSPAWRITPGVQRRAGWCKLNRDLTFRSVTAPALAHAVERFDEGLLAIAPVFGSRICFLDLFAVVDELQASIGGRESLLFGFLVVFVWDFVRSFAWIVGS